MLRKTICCLFSLLFIFCLCACSVQTENDRILPSDGSNDEKNDTSSPSDGSSNEKNDNNSNNNIGGNKVDILINSTVLSATLENNSSAKAFVTLLRKGALTVSMHDYGNFEKVGDLPESLVTNDERITTEPGDIILYQGNRITIYYDTNTWNFTRLGKIDGATKESLKALLGNGNVTVTFRLPRQESPAEGKKLVAYFSATGTTKKIAEQIKDLTGASVYEILPATPYTDADLAYYTDCRADREQNNPACRPAINGLFEKMSEYDTIFLGYPIWHGQAPRIIGTFLESYDFSGKRIIPFCTSHSSGIGSSDTALHSLSPYAKWESGRRFSGNTSRDTLAEWLDSIEG